MPGVLMFCCLAAPVAGVAVALLLCGCLYGGGYVDVPPVADTTESNGVKEFLKTASGVYVMLMVLFCICAACNSFIQRYLHDPLARQKSIFHADVMLFSFIRLLLLLIIILDLPLVPSVLGLPASFVWMVLGCYELSGVSYRLEWLLTFGLTKIQVFEVMHEDIFFLAEVWILFDFWNSFAVAWFVVIRSVMFWILALAQMLSFLEMSALVAKIVRGLCTGLRFGSLVEVAMLVFSLISNSFWPSGIVGYLKWIFGFLYGAFCLYVIVFNVITGDKYKLHGLVPGSHPLAA